MSMFSWFRGLLGFESAVALPAPVESRLPEQTRADASGTAASSVVSTLTGSGTTLDRGASARPVLVDPLTDTEIEALFRNGYGHKVCCYVPKHATRKGWEIRDGSQEVDGFSGEMQRIRLTDVLARAATWDRKWGGCLVIVNTTGTGRLETELDLDKIEEVTALHVVDATRAWPQEWNNDPNSPDMGLPLIWNVQLTADEWVPVHASRCLYFGGVTVERQALRYTPRRGFGLSIFDLVWESIRNRTEIDQGAPGLAVAFTQTVLKILGLRGQDASQQRSLIQTRLQAMWAGMSRLGMAVIGESEELTRTNQAVSGYRELDEVSARQMAAHADMAQAQLFGDPPSGLNTDGDSARRGQAESTESFQELVLREPILRVATMLAKAKKGPMKGVVPKDMRVFFRSVEMLTSLERAEVRFKDAQTDTAYVSIKALRTSTIAATRFGPRGRMEEMVPEDVDAIREREERAEEQGEALAEAAKAGLGTSPAESVDGALEGGDTPGDATETASDGSGRRPDKDAA